MNLDVLTRPFAGSEIKQRDGRGGKRFDYVEAHSVIARLNEAFDGQWSFRVLDRIIEEGEIAVLGELSAEGESKTQWGSKERNRGSSLGDDLKAATSDAVKKCATLFGVGLHLYAPACAAADREDANGSRQTPAYAGETEALTCLSPACRLPAGRQGRQGRQAQAQRALRPACCRQGTPEEGGVGS